MSSNYSDLNTLPFYKLYFDDIEEIFLNTVSFKYLFISSIIICCFISASIIILLSKSKPIFLACLIPVIYSLLFYDFIQLLSIILLKYNLININENYFGEICRWPYYLKASSEAGQCITLIFIYAIRCQKVRHFLKHKYLPNTGNIHSRALTFVCLLFIIYVNNWITHLKIEKIHVVTLNESNYGINIQEYPITFYGRNHVKLNDHQQFYSDLDKYAQNYEQTSIGQNKAEKIIYNEKDDSNHEIIIKIPYDNFFGQQKSISLNRTRRKLGKRRRHILNKTIYGNNSYRIRRCTFGQRNFFLANFLSLIHSIFYLILIIYYLTTVYRYKIPYIRSIREYFDLKIKSEGNIYFIERFEGTISKEKKTRFKASLANQTCLTDMNEQFSLPIVYQWLDTVIASLDCYTWVFSQGFLNPLLFQDNNQKSRLITSLSYFISKISMNTLHDIVNYFPASNQSYVFTPNDVRQFDTAKCTVIVRLLNFITAIWSKYPHDTKRAIEDSFYSNDLTKLILTCVFNPTQLGFDINNEEINKKLPERIMILLKSMTTHLPEQLLQPFYSNALQMTKSDGLYNLKNEVNMNPVRWSLIFTITRGLRLSHDVRLLPKPTQPEQYAKELWTTMLTKIITHEEDCDKANIVLTIDNQRGLQALFYYIIYLGIKPNEVLPYFFQSTRIHTDSGMATVGIYLLTLFKYQITSWLGTTPHFIINDIGEIK
ncbi:unnamed protein product [Rotaria sp. Silwood2]|nr:unnamed protein product [Rotaria sp. Silwood2]